VKKQVKQRAGSREPAAGARPPSVGFVSLGCPKALVDSERIVTRLRAEGYALSRTYEGADLVIVNTCGFIDGAVQESLEAIGEALDANGRVIVTGCLGARREGGENLVARVHPKVLAVTGPHATEAVIDHVHAHLPRPHDPFTDLMPATGIRLTPRHYAYLKISEGCNHRCSFCIIPSLRGDLVSRPIGEVLREAQGLLEQGVRELLVVSQDTGAYGLDLRYRLDFAGGRPVKTRLAELVRELGRLAADHGAWVRLHYVYPYPMIDEIVPLMEPSGRGGIVPYLDVPFQHAHPEVLKRMRRPASGEKNIERVRAWRRICPQITLRSTFIAGFPGETEAQFEVLLDFLREAQLDRVGCFAYSPVEGAAANALDGALPDELRQARRARLMQVQEAISRERLRARVGSVQRVLLDEIAPDGRTAVGRSTADAPEIDGVVRVSRAARAKTRLNAGEFVDVCITACDVHDLAGSVV